MVGIGSALRFLVGTLLISFLLLFSWLSPAFALDRTNIPLKNWDGFAIYRDWVYDALERLVTAGLADQAVLNTKPLTRVEAARIVAQAIERISLDGAGDYNHRGYLEDLLYRLIEEFKPELAALGVEVPVALGPPPGFLTLKPVDKLRVGIGYTTKQVPLVNSQGKLFEKGLNTGVALQGRAQVGDFLSLYLNPEFHGDAERTVVRLLTGYVKLTLWNVELEVGRDSIWWGPGLRGSMLFSNNARPLDMVRLSGEPWVPPWIFRYLGPTKLALVVARLEKSRDHPYAKVGAFRIDVNPFPYLEVGISPAIQFGGKGQPSIGLADIPDVIARYPRSEATQGKKFNFNSLGSADVTLRLPNVGRFVPLGRDLALYAEIGADDTLDTPIIPIPDHPGFLIGASIHSLFLSSATDLRIEYAKTSPNQFIHTFYRDGFSFKGRPLAHFIGSDGQDFFLRVTHYLQPTLQIGVEGSYSVIGSTNLFRPAIPSQKQFVSGFDISYVVTQGLSLFGAFRLQRVEDINFVRGTNATIPIFLLEATKSF